MRQNFSSTSEDTPASFGIYVHLPFCLHKCSYCDFYSFATEDDRLYEPLVSKVEWEIRESSRWLRSQDVVSPVKSIFFGGGTPSLMPTHLIRRLVDVLFECFAVEPTAEITLETNPETVSDRFCEGILSIGRINRISLGAQSFSPELLKKLERLGSRESIHAAVKTLRSHGMSRYNLDLIFGIPGQTRERMLADIREAASLDPEHLSFYSLTLKPGHVLYATLPTDDESADNYEAGIDELKRLGYAQYEISNFSRPGAESRHNHLYWNGGDFLGVGPSAASRFFWNGTFHHRKQFSDIHKYFALERFPEPSFEPTTANQTILEAAFLELRVNEGVRFDRFLNRYGYDLKRAKKYPVFLGEGLIVEEGDRVKLSARGRLLADRVTEELVDY